MFDLITWLQHFAEDIGGEAVGVSESVLSEPTDSGEEPAPTQEDVTMSERLRELGVPAEKTKRQRYEEKIIGKRAGNAPQPNKEGKPATSWDEFFAVPENKERMSKTISDRVKKISAENERYSKLAPAISLIAKQYGMEADDLTDLDVDSFVNAVTEDSRYYEEKASEMGVDVDTAKRIEKLEAEKRQRDRQDAIRTQEDQTRAHLMKLDQQAQELRQILPSFDLGNEIRTNPAFVRLTTPDLINSGYMTVKDAYIQTHPEMKSAINQVIAQKTLQQASNAIQSGSMRPQENGGNGIAGSVGEIKYSQMSAEQREAFKKNLKEQWANGRTVYSR